MGSSVSQDSLSAEEVISRQRALLSNSFWYGKYWDLYVVPVEIAMYIPALDIDDLPRGIICFLRFSSWVRMSEMYPAKFSIDADGGVTITIAIHTGTLSIDHNYSAALDFSSETISGSMSRHEIRSGGGREELNTNGSFWLTRQHAVSSGGALWHPTTHKQAPPLFRQQVLVIMCAHARPGTIFASLPRDVIYLFFRELSRGEAMVHEAFLRLNFDRIIDLDLPPEDGVFDAVNNNH